MQEINAKTTDGGVLVTETNEFQATKEDIRRKIDQLINYRNSMIDESARLKARFDANEKELKAYQTIMEEHFPSSGFVEVNDVTR